MESIRAVIVGDTGVGKSSLLISTCSNVVRDETPSVIPETKINLPHLGGRVVFTAVDTSADPKHAGDTRKAVSMASVVLVCFAFNDQRSLENALVGWLHNVKRWNKEAPIILVACKQDVQEPSQEQRSVLEREALRNEANVVTSTSCSAHSKDSILKVLTQAAEAVLYPLRPLFDRVHFRLRTRCKRAFMRIFRLCDIDDNGHLDDEELGNFQVLCFGNPMTARQLEDIKQLVLEQMPGGVTTQGLTLAGFLHLQTTSIMRERLDVTWQILTQFGYNKALELNDDLVAAAPERMSTESVAQLTLPAVSFLSAAFDAAASADGTLSESLLTLCNSTADGRGIFQNAPGPRGPLDDLVSTCLVPTAAPGRLSKAGFLALWAYCTLVDPRQAVKAMLYMGFRGSMLLSGSSVVGATAVQELLVCTPRHGALAETQPAAPAAAAHQRVFNCFVFGSTGCGKSTLLQRLVTPPQAPTGPPRPGPLAAPSNAPKATAAALVPTADAATPAALVLIEVSEKEALGVVTDPGLDAGRRARLQSSHAAFFCFDSRSEASFEAARCTLIAFCDLTRHAVPVALLACKSDLGMSSSMQLQVQSTCESLELAPAMLCNALHSDSQALLQALVQVAANPREHTATTPAMAAARRQRAMVWRCVKLAAIVSGVALSTLLCAYWGYNALRVRRESSPPAPPAAAAAPFGRGPKLPAAAASNSFRGQQSSDASAPSPSPSPSASVRASAPPDVPSGALAVVKQWFGSTS